MNKQPKIEIKETKNFVDKKELNLWKRGFTPQAEIWNGRMATVGVGVILIESFITNLKSNEFQYYLESWLIKAIIIKIIPIPTVAILPFHISA